MGTRKKKINSRSKGQVGEREIIELLYPVVAAAYETAGKEIPQLQRNTIQSDNGGFDIVGVANFAIEVKRCERLALDKWWEQTERQARQAPDRVIRRPVLLYRQNRSPWRARCRLNMRVQTQGYVPEPAIVDIDLDTFLALLYCRLCNDLGVP